MGANNARPKMNTTNATNTTAGTQPNTSITSTLTETPPAIPDPSPSDDSSTEDPQYASLTTADLDQLWRWNASTPPVLSQCMHDLVTEKARAQPDAVAVQAWDGSLTYGELEDLTSRLARRLLDRGVKTGTTIPLCFEKSMWAVVALLGVMKAGATFSLTDPSQPEARLRTIVEQTGAELVITSVAQGELGSLICPDGQVLAISREYFDNTPDMPTQELPRVPPTTPLYIIFTSGSTGKPKGVVISHENYTSGAIPRAEAVGYTSTSRVFDFPSYAFDVSIDCMLCTLANGGRICVPSEEERMNDLSGAIRRSNANMVHMTPSVARVLDADLFSSLEVLGLGGEAVSASDAAVWSKTTSLVIAYGPSECTVGCTINNTVSISTGIGKGVGGTTWIVDPDNHDRLVPVGAVGELLIEGPVVGIGYLGEPAKTAEVFIEDPSWLVAGLGAGSGRRGRLYKTGDLVRYESNGLGSIEFVGRKDQQVKLRGQRVELAEVEHHLRSCLPPSLKIATEVIKPSAGAPTLVAFISEPSFASAASAEGPGSLFAQPSPGLSSALAQVDTVMGSKVPRYMVPVAFITLKDMPSLVSGKIDRKKLREIGASMPREQLGHVRDGQAADEEPETEAEKQLRRAWVKVLGPESKVFRQSNFFGLGGDSLRAMRLVAAAREQGLVINVANIFTTPFLDTLALQASPITETAQDIIEPFSLLDGTWSREAAKGDTAGLCSLSTDDIEDVYPCTPLQEALMALSAKVKEAYVAQRVVELDDINQAERLVSAFQTAEKDCPILRTRVVQVPARGLVQVVVNSNKTTWHRGTNLNEYLESDRNTDMELGTPLVRYAIIHDGATDKVSFVLTMHHALYDGWSMPLVVERVNKAYENESLPDARAAFKHFIKYLGATDATSSESYWREQLDGASGLQFPSLPFQGYQTRADSLLEVYVPLESLPASNATVATVIRAAWALVVSQYTNSPDVVFGETLTGRNAPLVGAEAIEGPMITTVPVRIQADRDISVAEYLQTIQDQTVAQIPHEHFGLQHIRKLSPDAFEACELRTGLVLHPSTANDPLPDQSLPANRLVPAGDAEAAQEALKFNTYALMLVCSIEPQGFLVMASFDSKTVNEPTMQRVLDEFKQTVQALCSQTSSLLGDVSCLTEKDFVDLQRLASVAEVRQALGDYPDAQAAYVVDPQDPNRILPPGAIGELVVQSLSELPLPKLSTPTWLSKICSSDDASHTQSTLFKTDKPACLDPITNTISFPTPPTKPSNQTSVRPPSKRVSATSQKQRKLRFIWSRVLKVDEQDIGLNDSFFLLGGDSISAMKLVSEARVQGVRLTVMQIFQKRSLYDMASVMVQTQEEEKPEPAAEMEPFSLLNKPDGFVSDVVQPQLANAEWKIVNVLPTRPLQQIAVKGSTQIPRFSMRYELMYFDGEVDRPRLSQSCRDLVAQNEILRTAFVEHENEGFGVVVEDIYPSVVELEIDSDVEGFAKQLCHLDIQTRIPLGSSFVKFFLVRAPSSGRSCLIFRISHAQYDEICLPILLQQLSNLYEGKPVQKTIPFSSYVGHVVRQSVPNSLAYWRDLLAGSTMSVLKPDIAIERRNHFAIQKTLDMSSRPRDVTAATLPTAAWALCLARRLSLRDVTFGEVVSGRNIDFPDADAVAGPCWQYVPVRVRLNPEWTSLDLLTHIQHQHVASSAHEGVGFSEIVDQCTDWADPKPEWFDTVVHQDVAHVETLGFEVASGRLETVYPHEEPLREWKIQAFIQGDKLTFEIVTFDSWAKYAEGVLDELVEVAEVLVREPQSLLFTS